MCVIGIVRVKVAGPVQNGERIYASTSKPGIGIPETQMPLRAPGNRSPILLGQSLETAHSSTLDTVKSVKCFVSVILGVQSEQIRTAVEDVRRDTRLRIAECIKREKQRFLRSTYHLNYFVESFSYMRIHTVSQRNMTDLIRHTHTHRIKTKHMNIFKMPERTSVFVPSSVEKRCYHPGTSSDRNNSDV